MLSLFMVLVAPAWAWPADAEWLPLTVSGGNLVDPAGDHTDDGSLDLFGDASTSAAWWYADADALYLRMQLSSDPMSGGSLKPLTWGFLFELDGDDTFDFLVVS